MSAMTQENEKLAVVFFVFDKLLAKVLMLFEKSNLKDWGKP